MHAEQKLGVHLAGLADLGTVGVDDHAVEHAVVARRDKLVDAIDLDHADATGPDLVEVAQVAQGRNLDTDGACGVEDRGPLLDLGDLAVDC